MGGWLYTGFNHGQCFKRQEIGACATIQQCSPKSQSSANARSFKTLTMDHCFLLYSGLLSCSGLFTCFRCLSLLHLLLQVSLARNAPVPIISVYHSAATVPLPIAFAFAPSGVGTSTCQVNSVGKVNIKLLLSCSSFCCLMRASASA